MTGRRRNPEAVVARPFIQAVTAAVVLLALGNLLAFGCLISWFQILDSSSPFHSGMWFMVAAALGQFVAASVVLAAWAWAR